MKPVDQTRFEGAGNCFQACVASILELPLEQVPDFMQEEDWQKSLGKFCYLHGLTALQTQSSYGGIDTYSIISGKSPRGDGIHSCVFKGQEIVHDPHPSRAGILFLYDQIVFIADDPAIVVRYSKGE